MEASSRPTVVIVYAVQVSGLSPPFLYHATSKTPAFALADSTSIRPSASRSDAYTEYLSRPAPVTMVYAVQVSGLPPPFLYHATFLSV
jgi:hypothetical protein